MKIKYLTIGLIVILASCSQGQENKEIQQIKDPYADGQFLVKMLDTIWTAEQVPIRKRDSLMDIYGVESKEADVYQKIYRKNHAINIKKIRAILDNHGWPEKTVIEEQGNRTICNVLQHADQRFAAWRSSSRSSRYSLWRWCSRWSCSLHYEQA